MIQSDMRFDLVYFCGSVGCKPSTFRLRRQRGRELLTVRAAAACLGVSYSTFKQWIYKGSVRPSARAAVTTASPRRMEPPWSQGRIALRAGPNAPCGVVIAISGRNQLRGVVEEVRVEGLLAQVRLRIGISG
jgi:hypothetical protein